MSRIKQNRFLLVVIFIISCSLNNNYMPEDFFGLRLTKKCYSGFQSILISAKSLLRNIYPT